MNSDKAGKLSAGILGWIAEKYRPNIAKLRHIMTRLVKGSKHFLFNIISNLGKKKNVIRQPMLK